MNFIKLTDFSKSFPYLLSFDLKFFDGKQQHFDLSNQQDFDLVLKKVIEKPVSHRPVATISFSGHTSIENMETRMKIFQESALANVLQFSQADGIESSIAVQYRILEVEDLCDGKTRRKYANGIIETYDTNNQCHRLLSDGAQEWGEFDEHNRFICAYRTEVNGRSAFIKPKVLIRYTNKASKEYKYERIVEFQDKLILLEEKYSCRSKSLYIIGKRTLIDVLLSFTKEEAFSISGTKDLQKVLMHEAFKNHLPGLFETVLTPDETGNLPFFDLPDRAAVVIIEMGSRAGYVDPFQVIDRKSKRNLFAHAISTKNSALLEKLIELFPEKFQSIASDIIEELIMEGYEVSFIQKLITKVQKIIGELPYYELWLKIALYKKPDQDFHKELTLLSEKHKNMLYQAAFAYNNPFVFEPATVPINPEKYSINLMWINDKKIPSDQRFLFGDGYTSENQELDFNKRFIIPVSAWAEKNPEGTPINIWVDGKMATPDAIEGSRIRLEESLNGKSHGKIMFRDVRTIPTVTDNEFIFSQNFPIYFRVDLLRAIIADYVLNKKETQFFVYGDIDMEPLSGYEIFDQKTILFLNEYGGVMAKGGHHGYENGFQILNGSHSSFMKIHLETIINTNIKKADQGPAIREQQVYDTYPKMWSRLLKSKDEFLLRKMIPTKPVQLPPSHFG